MSVHASVHAGRAILFYSRKNGDFCPIADLLYFHDNNVASVSSSSSLSSRWGGTRTPNGEIPLAARGSKANENANRSRRQCALRKLIGSSRATSDFAYGPNNASRLYAYLCRAPSRRRKHNGGFRTRRSVAPLCPAPPGDDAHPAPIRFRVPSSLDPTWRRLISPYRRSILISCQCPVAYNTG